MDIGYGKREYDATRFWTDMTIGTLMAYGFGRLGGYFAIKQQGALHRLGEEGLLNSFGGRLSLGWTFAWTETADLLANLAFQLAYEMKDNNLKRDEKTGDWYFTAPSLEQWARIFRAVGGIMIPAKAVAYPSLARVYQARSRAEAVNQWLEQWLAQEQQRNQANVDTEVRAVLSDGKRSGSPQVGEETVPIAGTDRQRVAVAQVPMGNTGRATDPTTAAAALGAAEEGVAAQTRAASGNPERMLLVPIAARVRAVCQALKGVGARPELVKAFETELNKIFDRGCADRGIASEFGGLDTVEAYQALADVFLARTASRIASGHGALDALIRLVTWKSIGPKLKDGSEYQAAVTEETPTPLRQQTAPELGETWSAFWNDISLWFRGIRWGLETAAARSPEAVRNPLLTAVDAGPGTLIAIGNDLRLLYAALREGIGSFVSARWREGFLTDMRFGRPCREEDVPALIAYLVQAERLYARGQALEAGILAQIEANQNQQLALDPVLDVVLLNTLNQEHTLLVEQYVRVHGTNQRMLIQGVQHCRTMLNGYSAFRWLSPQHYAGRRQLANPEEPGSIFPLLEEGLRQAYEGGTMFEPRGVRGAALVELRNQAYNGTPEIFANHLAAFYRQFYGGTANEVVAHLAGLLRGRLAYAQAHGQPTGPWVRKLMLLRGGAVLEASEASADINLPQADYVARMTNLLNSEEPLSVQGLLDHLSAFRRQHPGNDAPIIALRADVATRIENAIAMGEDTALLLDKALVLSETGNIPATPASTNINLSLGPCELRLRNSLNTQTALEFCREVAAMRRDLPVAEADRVIAALQTHARNVSPATPELAAKLEVLEGTSALAPGNIGGINMLGDYQTAILNLLNSGAPDSLQLLCDHLSSLGSHSTVAGRVRILTGIREQAAVAVQNACVGGAPADAIHLSLQKLALIDRAVVPEAVAAQSGRINGAAPFENWAIDTLRDELRQPSAHVGEDEFVNSLATLFDVRDAAVRNQHLAELHDYWSWQASHGGGNAAQARSNAAQVLRLIDENTIGALLNGGNPLEVIQGAREVPGFGAGGNETRNVIGDVRANVLLGRLETNARLLLGLAEGQIHNVASRVGRLETGLDRFVDHLLSTRGAGYQPALVARVAAARAEREAAGVAIPRPGGGHIFGRLWRDQSTGVLPYPNFGPQERALREFVVQNIVPQVRANAPQIRQLLGDNAPGTLRAVGRLLADERSGPQHGAFAQVGDVDVWVEQLVRSGGAEHGPAVAALVQNLRAARQAGVAADIAAAEAALRGVIEQTLIPGRMLNNIPSFRLGLYVDSPIPGYNILLPPLQHPTEMAPATTPFVPGAGGSPFPPTYVPPGPSPLGTASAAFWEANN